MDVSCVTPVSHCSQLVDYCRWDISILKSSFLRTLIQICIVFDQRFKSVTRCYGSDGNAEDSRQKVPGFNLWLRQEKIENILSYFQLVALEPIRSTSKYLHIQLIFNIHKNEEEATMFLQGVWKSLLLFRKQGIEEPTSFNSSI